MASGRALLYPAIDPTMREWTPSFADRLARSAYPAASILEEQQQLLLAQGRGDEAESAIELCSIRVDRVGQH